MPCRADCLIEADQERFASQPVRKVMELVSELERDEMGHWWRMELACRDCGQHYFFEFFEEIDWNGGNDPQLSIYVPIYDQSELEPLMKCRPGFVTPKGRFFRTFWPSNGDRVIGWVG